MKGNSIWRYWVTLAVCCGLAGSSIGILTNSVGVFYTPVSEALGVGRGAFALHATLSMLACGFFCPVMARLMGRYPMRLLLGTGVALACGSTAAMAAADSLPLFYVLGTLRGVGVAFFSIMPVTTIIGNWFEKNHGLAVGVALSFSGLGGAVFSPALTAVIQSAGWRSAYLFMAAAALAMALPGVLLVRKTPAEVSLPPLGGRMIEVPAVQAASVPAPKKQGGREYLLLLVMMSGFAMLHNSIAGIGQHFPGIAESMGTGAAVGAAMVSAGMVGNIVTKLVLGVLSDRIGPFPASICMITLNGCALLVMIFFGGNAAVALVSAFFYGAAYSVGAVGMPLLTRNLFGVEGYSSAYSTITLVGSLGNAFAMTLVGLVYDVMGSYQLALVCGVIVDCVNLGLLAVLPRLKKR